MKSATLAIESNKTENIQEITPTIRYFIEKINGNTDLAEREKEAMVYVEKNEPVTPPDWYFQQKLNRVGFNSGLSFFGPSMDAMVMSYYESDAINYTKSQFLDTPSSSLRNSR